MLIFRQLRRAGNARGSDHRPGRQPALPQAGQKAGGRGICLLREAGSRQAEEFSRLTVSTIRTSERVTKRRAPFC